MFNVDEMIVAKHRVCVLSTQSAPDRQFVAEMQAMLPGGTPCITYQSSANTAVSDQPSEQYDLGIVVLNAGLLEHHRDTIALTQLALDQCATTIAFATLPHDARNDAASLSVLQQLQANVDTLVLVPGQKLPVEIVATIPQLLSGSSFIGIDYADIMFVLSGSPASNAAMRGVYLADSEPYTDATDVNSAAGILSHRISATAQALVDYCLFSLCICPGQRLTLKEGTQAVHGVYERICQPGAPQVFGMPVLHEKEIVDGMSMVSIAGPVELGHGLIERLIAC